MGGDYRLTGNKEMVPEARLELARTNCPLAPQASVSTNSTTPALAYSFIIQERDADVKLLFSENIFDN
jgi:hypothetical protein